MTQTATVQNDTPGALPVQQFNFTSKLFAVPGARFARASDNTPVLHVQLGELAAVLPFPPLVKAFQISPQDRGLLNLVARGLRYIKEIRPGDTIPSEVLDGTASWAADERHAVAARNRLTVHLVGWAGSKPADIKDSADLLRLAGEPDFAAHTEAALVKAAQILKIAEGGPDGVSARIESLARELTYIEALRERFGQIHGLVTMLNALEQHFRGDQAVTDSIRRIRSLLKAPLRRFQAIFDALDAMTSEVIPALKNVGNQIEFTRKNRDELWDNYMAWQDIIVEAGEAVLERSGACEVLVRRIYQLVASRYPQEQTWR